MIKRIKTLSIPLLLAFFALNFLHISTILPQSHSAIKAVINEDDTKAKAFSDDEKKQPIYLQLLFVLVLVISTAMISPLQLLLAPSRKLIFLIPVFHQSNYLILPPNS
ncbi:hypothetical protein FAY30_02265 [Bacillus sp. S3]|nr:hypothetical protein [Bacillus sp. S3]QCJ40824.1 hypothetical protein FAY30_02265 [Bacillus sp. S3]